MPLRRQVFQLVMLPLPAAAVDALYSASRAIAVMCFPAGRRLLLQLWLRLLLPVSSLQHVGAPFAPSAASIPHPSWR